MICSRCLTENPDNSKFCRECGERQTSLCPQCGGQVSPASKACAACGYLLPPVMPKEKSAVGSSGEKRQVTILFSDLTGFTALMQRLDPEEAKEILAGIFMETTKAVNAYGGFIEKYIGDAIMAMFGADRAHEDDPIRAIKAAQEIHKRMKALSLRFAKEAGVSLQMHTGINTGLVVTGESTTEKGIHGLTGDAVNSASRLMEIAGPGEIIVCPDTYHRVKGHFQFEKGKSARIKGEERDVQTYKVLPPAPDQHRTSRLSGMRAELTGRDRELDILKKALSELKTGKGSIIAIAGNPGTGKSRLVEELKGLIDLSEIQWREGHAYEYTHDIPYYPVTDMLRRTLLIHENYTPEQIRSRLENHYRFILGERKDLMPYMGSLFSLEYDMLEEISPDRWKAKLHEAIRIVIDNVSRTLPTVYCFEDMQWADPSSVELIKAAISGLNYPVLFMCTYRPPFTLFDARHRRSLLPIHEILIGDLSPEESVMMTGSFLETKELPPELIMFVREKVEGNPFFIEEVLRTLVDAKALVKEDGGWVLGMNAGGIPVPATVQGVILARVDRLSEYQKRVLREASVIGREFPFELLKGVTAVKEEIHETVAYLERMDLIKRNQLAPQLTYVFKHILTREAIYGGLLKKDLREIHEAVGMTMEQMFQSRLPEYYERLAFHFSRGHSVHRAVFYLRKAGEKNLLRHSLQEAHQFYSEAFSLLSEKTDKSREDELILLDILFDWTVIHYHRAAYSEMLELLTRQEPLVLSVNDEARTGLFLIRTGSALSRMERNREAYRHFSKALSIGERFGDAGIIANACTWLIMNCADLGLFDEAASHAERVRSMDLYSSDSSIFRLATASLGYVHYFRGESGKAHQAGKQLLDYGFKNFNMRCTALGYACHGSAYLSAGDYGAAIEHYKKSIGEALEPIYSYASKLMLGLAYIANGQYLEAEEMLNEVVSFNREHGYGSVGTMAEGLSGIVSIIKGDLKSGIERIEGAIESCARNESRYRHAMLNLSLGRVYLKMLQGGEKKDPSFYRKNLFFLLRTLPVAHKKAEQHLTRALKTAEAIGAKSLQGQACLESGRLCTLRRKKPRAAEHLQEAVRIFEECKADEFLHQARDLLTSLS